MSDIDLSGLSDIESSLKVFRDAKHELIDLFQRLGTLSNALQSFICGQEISLLVKGSDVVEMLNFDENISRVTAILKMLSRNSMKVCFFGRTSNGKSTVINCMLRDRILPAGLGHTTNCFLQIEGSNEAKDTGPYCIVPGHDDKPFEIDVLDSIANEEGDDFKVGISELVRIIWPKDACKFLNEDIVLIDSPGIDVSADLDSWIEAYCMDADVFVLVCNSEAVLSRTERNFFVSVSEKLSSPNIFILNNRWDMTSNERRMHELRKQHQKLETEFLCVKIKVCSTEAEASKRIFFVSAKETLSKRILELRPDANETIIQLPGNDERSDEFDAFEQEFTKCISQSAVRTKFKPHTEQGFRIACHYIHMLKSLLTEIQEKSYLLEEKHKEFVQRAENMERRLHELTYFVKDRIGQVSMVVEEKVSCALYDESIRLADLVDKFKVPFNSEANHISYYKEELNKYLEQKLGENLSSRLGRVLATTTETVGKDVRDRIVELLADDVSSINDVLRIVYRVDFSSAYSLYFSNLCSDFSEDISFKFSLSPYILFARISARFRKNVKRDTKWSPTAPPLPTAQSQEAMEIVKRYSHQSQQSSGSLTSTTTNTLLAMQALAFLSSPNSAAAVAIVGGSTIAFRGWKILIGVGVAIGSVYVIERAMWTRRAQERTFKRQYVDFASAKLKMVADKTSGTASQQVQHELSLYFAQVCRYVDESKDRVLDQVGKLEDQLKNVISVSQKLKTFLDSATAIRDAIDGFSHKFLFDTKHGL